MLVMFALCSSCFLLPASYFLTTLQLNIIIGQWYTSLSEVYLLATFLALILLVSDSLLFAISLFFSSSLLLAHVTIGSSMLLGLLALLVYLGALLVLFAYLWMFVSFCSRSPITLTPLLVLVVLIFSSWDSHPSSISPYLYPSSLLLFLVVLLFFAIVVVVVVLDLSLGGFTA